MSEVELAIHDGESSAGGAHAIKLRVLEGIALDAVVGSEKGIQQCRLGIAGEIAIVEMADGLDRDPAGFLTAFVSTHAVGHDGEAPLAAEFLICIRLPVEKGILVILALQADVGQAGGFDPWSWSLTVHRHRRGREWLI